jgi:hypothetical protein
MSSIVAAAAGLVTGKLARNWAARTSFPARVQLLWRLHPRSLPGGPHRHGAPIVTSCAVSRESPADHREAFPAAVLISSGAEQRSQLTIKSVSAEAVEFSQLRASEKCMPLVRRKSENGPRGIPAVAEADAAVG